METFFYKKIYGFQACSDNYGLIIMVEDITTQPISNAFESCVVSSSPICNRILVSKCYDTSARKTNDDVQVNHIMLNQ